MTPNDDRFAPLWPHGLLAALLALPLVWLVVLLIVSATQRLAGWPPPDARRVTLWLTLVVSLVPIALRLIDVARRRWGGRGGGEDAQSQAVAQIRLNRANYEDMASRTPGPPPPEVTAVIARFADIAADAGTTTDEDKLAALVEESEMLAQRRASICPKANIASEVESHLATLENMGLSTKTLESLKKIAQPAFADLKDAEAVNAARAALRVTYEEYDEWQSYIDEYNEKMSFWTRLFLLAIAVFATTALFVVFGFSAKVLALVLAAVAGATASVMAHLPPLTSYGEWEVNLRAWQARIGTGIVGSLVGIGLLGSGWITIPLPDPWKSASSLLNACLGGPTASAVSMAASGASTSVPSAGTAETAAATAPARCEGSGMLFILAVTMLLGFSERLLTSLEGRVVAAAPAAANQPRP